MQLPPLETFTPEMGGASAEEKKADGTGFSEALAIALGAGLALFDPSSGAGGDVQESLMEVLSDEIDDSHCEKRGTQSRPETARATLDSDGEAEAQDVTGDGEVKDGDGDLSSPKTHDTTRQGIPAIALHGAATSMKIGAVQPGQAGGLEIPAGRGKSISAHLAAKAAKGPEASGLAGRVLKIVQVLRRDGLQHFQGMLRISTQELGTLRMEIEMKDEALNIRFLVSGIEGRQAVEAQMDRLRESLERQGFHNPEITVELGDAGEDGSWGSESPEAGEGVMADGEEALTGLATRTWDGIIDTLA